MDGLFLAFTTAVAGYAAICLLVYLLQSSQVYFPDRTIRMVPSDMGMPYEELRLGTGTDAPITAWFVPAPEKPDSAPTLLFCHGNAGNIGDRCGSLATFRGMGFNVLVFDYQGYGTSAGKPTEEGTYRDARLAWDYLTTARGVAASRVVLFGRSLGGAVAVSLAAETHPAALVIESSFSSAPDMARRMFPFLPMRFLCRFNYDSVAAIPAVRCPVLIAHSRDDEMIPVEQGKRVFNAAREPKRFVELSGGHNDTGLDGDPAYRELFKSFAAVRVTPIGMTAPPVAGTDVAPAGPTDSPAGARR